MIFPPALVQPGSRQQARADLFPSPQGEGEKGKNERKGIRTTL